MAYEQAIKLPLNVEKRLTHLGTAGELWRTSLAARVSHLCTQWSLALGAVMHGGSEALVLEAQNAGGEELVLKLLLPSIAKPGQSAELVNNEHKVLQAAQGNGYVHLVALDETYGAILMPRLGAPLGLSEADPSTQQRILCETLKRAWQNPAQGLGLQTGAQKALWLRSLITQLGKKHTEHISKAALSVAIEFSQRREHAYKQAAKVLVHGDAHPFNALRAADGSYALIDPDGLYAEPEYDLGVLMREASDELLDDCDAPIERGKARCERLALQTTTQPLAIWQWGYIERVSTGLYCLELDMPDYGKPALLVANSWANQGALNCYI